MCYNRELPSVPARIQNSATHAVCSPKHQIRTPKRPYIKGDKSDHRNGTFTKKDEINLSGFLALGCSHSAKLIFIFFCQFQAKWLHEIIMSYKSLRGETWDLYMYEYSRTCVIFRSKKRQCFPLLEQENMVFILRQIPPICLVLYGSRVQYVCVCVCAKVGAIQETLWSVCIFSQSDWSKTQPLMCHFKWTPGPNENTHTYKPHLIEGYRFSHRSFLFFFFSFFFQGENGALFENQYS